MNALCCSMCGACGVRLYRPLGGENHPDLARCNGCVPDGYARRCWAPLIPGGEKSYATLEAIMIALERWLRLPEASPRSFWSSRFAWVDIENAPGASRAA